MTFHIDRPINLFHGPSTLVKDEIAVPNDAFRQSHMAYYGRHHHHYPSPTPTTHSILDPNPTTMNTPSRVGTNSPLASMPDHHGMTAVLPFPPAPHTHGPTPTSVEAAAAAPSDRILSIPWPSFTSAATTDPVSLQQQQQQSYWLYDHQRQHQDIVAATQPASVPAHALHHPLAKRPSQQQPHPRRSGDATPRRYKCSICVKRFSRPSSLATHMHSHTGEKPYTCQVEGCGRRFSVVSNLRRHAKIHINKASSP